MPKPTIKELLSAINNFGQTTLWPKLSKLPDYLVLFISSWWHLILIALAALVFLYYPIGGMIVENIDRNTSYEINDSQNNHAASVEMASFIINREINEKMWTPNLPFFFPSYFLDNMPAFQLGMFDSLAKFSKVLSSVATQKIIDENTPQHLAEAAELLKYPGTVWMFSPTNKLLLAPSANTQYRKARSHLIKYNASLADGSEVWYKNPQDLSLFLKRAQTDLWKNASQKLEQSIRENSNDLFDSSADNVFYYTQGKVYAYYLLFKALGQDYKDIIVKHNAYANWTAMLKALEQASQIDPGIVRNGKLDSLSAPNHLAALGFYILKAETFMNKINYKISTPLKVKE